MGLFSSVEELRWDTDDVANALTSTVQGSSTPQIILEPHSPQMVYRCLGVPFMHAGSERLVQGAVRRYARFTWASLHAPVI